jgi:DNA-binding response OmpR family regulator
MVIGLHMTANPVILIADDSASVRVHLKHRLQRAGFDVVLAENGNKAIEQVVQSVPDAAILDINMPELDGYGVCERLAELDKELPVIFLTSVNSNAVKMLGEKWGAYLAKPVCGEKLVQTVNHVLSASAEM